MSRIRGKAWMIVVTVLVSLLWQMGVYPRVLTNIAAAAEDASAIERKYAPDRKVDILHIIIDVTPDFENRTIAGTTTIRFAPIAVPLRELRLNAIDLLISSVTSETAIDDYSISEDAIAIVFDKAIAPGKETTVTITYEAEPKQGLYFRTPGQGYTDDTVHLFSQGECHTAPHWYPNYDYPNERSTSEVICRVPPYMTVLSNGRLISEKTDKKTNLKSVRWLQDKPHANYLIALVAGKFECIESKYRDIPIAFYTSPGQIDLAKNSFKGTADMMAFFEEEIGIAYPWNKYYQVTVKDFVAGGMENTTLTILTDGTLFSEESENCRSSESLVAHEMAHQWFGDYVTCKDWSHIWLNEGFATYYEKLYDGHANGRDALLYSLYRSARGILSATGEQRTIVRKGFRHADDQFSYLTYQKGAWVLHMLRSQLGKELYRRCVKTYLERFAFSSTVTADLISVIEELSGRSYDRFFDEWVFQGRFPELKVSYTWLGKDKLAKVSIQQTQKPLNGVGVYHFPAKVRFIMDRRVIDREIEVDSKQHDFYFPLEGEPEVVRFDPDCELLAKVEFKKTKPMLYAQLGLKDDVIGRLLAVEALKGHDDKKAVAKLKDVLNGDAFYGVRMSASGALRHMASDEAFTSLVESLDQADSRVRERVAEDVGSFYRPEALAAVMEIVDSEANPDIRSGAIRKLGLYNSRRTKKLLASLLQVESFHNTIAQAAVSAIRTMDDPYFVSALRKVISERAEGFTTSGLSSALETLAHISRNKKNKAAIREFVTGYVNHANRRIRAGALGALGTLGDPKAIPIVQAFDGDKSYDRVQRSAKSALRKLQERKQLVPREIIELRELVDELKKDNEKLRGQFEELNERLDAREEVSGEGK